MNIEDFKNYLPKFLSPESASELFSSLKDFPDNMDSRFYTDYLVNSPLIYQGDGLKDMLVVNLPQTEIKPVPSMILSNTCDIDLMNIRNFSSQIVYSPIFNLQKYMDKLLEKSDKDRDTIIQHIESIKKQAITQIFYLPKLGTKIEESIVFFDRVCNFPNKEINRETLNDRRIFTLSDYGAYLFLLKLSIHYTRMNDQVERKGFTEM